MKLDSRAKKQLLALAFAVLSLGVWSPAGSGAASPRGCPSFASQADAQAFFMARGGSPGQPVGGLDADRDGVACETDSGPYQGYATVGYNRKRSFFYGTATMPSGDTATGSAGYPCLYGNERRPDAPRRLNLYKVRSGGDKALFASHGLSTEAKPTSGRLVWRADRMVVPRGRYYAEFEERLRSGPHGRGQCPAFRSRAVSLP